MTVLNDVKDKKKKNPAFFIEPIIRNAKISPITQGYQNEMH